MSSSSPLPIPASPLASPSRTHITQHSAYKGAQAASLIVPPAYILYSLTKSTFSINHLLRATALGVGVLGPAVGAAMAVGKMGGMGEGEVVEKDGRLRGSVTQTRVNDYSTIGAVVGALVTTSIFYKSARTPYALLGGAGLGIAGGVLTHEYKSYTEGRDVVPTGMVDPGVVPHTGVGGRPVA